MTESTPPGERRLARPPSERYRPPDPEQEVGTPAPRSDRLALAAVAALITAAALTLAGGVMLVTAGLIAVAALGGWAVGAIVRSGSGSARSRGRRITIAVSLALVGVVLGQLGLWAYGEIEGGALGLFDYLAQVFGYLVPLELLAATGAAWLAAR